MINKADPKRLMTKYLLDELSDAERVEFEELYLNSNEVFQELVAIENEMIDQYILGELSPVERDKFEKSYMTDPARREGVEMAQALLAVSTSESAGTPKSIAREEKHWIQRRLGLGAAAAIVALVAGGSLLLVVNHRLKNDVAKLRREQAALLQDKQMLEGQAERLRADLRDREHALRQLDQPASRNTVSISLGAGQSRGDGEVNQLVIPHRASQVLLRIIVEGKPLARYSLFLSTAEGVLTWRSDNMQGKAIDQGVEIVASIPSRLLHQNGDYVIRVASGGEAPRQALVGYSFHVVKR